MAYLIWDSGGGRRPHSNMPLVYCTIEPFFSMCNCFPGRSGGKESACNAGDPGSIPGSRRSPEEGNGNPLQYSCLENPMDREPWQAIVPRGCKESDTTEHALRNAYCA